MGKVRNKSRFNNLSAKSLFILLTLLITVLAMLTSYQPIWANIPINIILPIIVLLKLDTVFFEKLKLSTLLLMRVLIVFAVLGFVPGDLYVKIVLAFLCINILEATLTDLRKKKYCNVITGIALVVTVFLMKGTWLDYYYIATSDGILGMVFWIIAYTIWNWIFVTNEFSPAIALYHVGVLSAPLLGIMFKQDPGLWLIFRGNSLTIAGIIQIANKEYLEEKFMNRGFTNFVETISKKNVQIILMIINLILLAAMVKISIF